MNERIKELAEQAGLLPRDIGPVVETRHMAKKKHDLEKFAELVVRECVSIVSKRKNQAIDDEWNVDEAMTTAEIDIEEHFGVK